MEVVVICRSWSVATIALILLRLITSLTRESAEKVEVQPSLNIVDIIPVPGSGFDSERFGHHVVLRIGQVFYHKTDGLWHHVSQHESVHDSDGVIVPVDFASKVVLVYTH